MGKTKLWKNGGQEDKFIEDLMDVGKLTKNTKAKSLKREYPKMFESFSENVMRNHITELKRRHGLCLDEASGEENDDEVNSKQSLQEQLNKVQAMSKVPVSTGTIDGQMIHNNYPYLCETYKDPESQMDKVLVAVCVPGGAQNIKMELNNDGTAVIVKYNWAKIMYNMDDMFRKSVANGHMTLYHPKVLCLKNELKKRRSRIDADPEASITINLPMKVQTKGNSWNKGGALREDGSQVVTGDFSGYVKEYNKKLADKLIFDILN